MKILLIENDSDDIEYLKEILKEFELIISKEIPGVVPEDFDLVVTDYFFESGTALNFISHFVETNNTKVPIILISGNIDMIPFERLPTAMNFLILSKNDNLKYLLPYYINMFNYSNDTGQGFDYKTLFMSLVHDLINDLSFCSYYDELSKSSNENTELEEFNRVIIESAMFAFTRLNQYSTLLTASGHEFLSLSEIYSTVKNSRLIKNNIENINLIGNVEEKITFMPSFFLSIILKNLIENSCKYKSEGRSLVVNIEYLSLASEYQIIVSDNSIGMTKEQSRQLFKKSQDSKNGFGVGLTVLNRIIESFGGAIVIKSSIGNGTKIRLVFKK